MRLNRIRKRLSRPGLLNLVIHVARVAHPRAPIPILRSAVANAALRRQWRSACRHSAPSRRATGALPMRLTSLLSMLIHG